MKTNIATIALSALLAASAFAHEAITIGPNGGRVLYVDSVTTPNVEIIVNDGRAEIALLDKNHEPIPLDEQSIVVNAGPRRSAKTLDVERKDGKFVTEVVPSGAPYFIVMQLKEATDSGPITLRLNYDPTEAESGKPAYLDDSVNENSGENIEVPPTAKGIWAELNQHQKELEDAVPEKDYEAVDEITRAYPKLAEGLPAQSGDKRAAASALVETLVDHLAAVHVASAARKLDDAAADVKGVKSVLAELKKLYPESVANARLAE
ncbi:hypothetical protein BH23VER1_BH23VER1_00950 [soil metagenome]